MFVTRLSEELEGKAAGGKGSEACWSTSRTFFADNADPRALQPITTESRYETSCGYQLELPKKETMQAFINQQLKDVAG